MNEACKNFLGKTIGDREGKKFAIYVLDFMREVLIDFQRETGNNYNLEATPAEGTSYSLAKIDKERYPDILSAGNVDRDQCFYTNSTHLPVDFTDDVFDALDLQDSIQQKYTGGTVFHIYVGERISNSGSVKSMVRTICEKYHLPYFTFSPTFSVCPVHGYLNGEQSMCPKCGTECEVYSRVVGYLRPLKQWNRGKQQEFQERKMFKV